MRELWASFQNRLLKFTGSVRNLNRPLRLLLITAGVVAITLIFAFLLEKVFIYFFAATYVDAIADSWDLNKNLANAIVWLVFAATVVLFGSVFSFSRRKRLIGIVGVLGLLIGQSLLVWLGTSGAFFDRSGRAAKCYVITRDEVHFRERAGIDPATGRECRPVTPEIVERLSAYAAGKRPDRITSQQVTFFSVRTGEPIVWFYKKADDSIDLFDLMGFHPETGEELLPITGPVVSQWRAEVEKRKKQEDRRPPRKVPPDDFFHPITGDALRWYWRDEKGGYEFYDNPGYHPRTGDQLKQFTKKEFAIYSKEIAESERRRKEEADRKNAERERQQEENRVEAARQEELRREREKRREKEAQAAKLCDQLAGNPNDPRRAAEGVPFDALKAHLEEAIQVCERAIAQSPNEPRFQYQLARALAVDERNRKRALPVLQKLVAMRYPAAYDNLGWLIVTERKNFVEAVNLFRAGAQLGDPDAMVSLAGMIDRHATPIHPSETKIALYKRAAQLGHPGAAKALQEEQQKEDSQERQRALEAEQQRRFKGLFEHFLQRMPR